MDLCDIRTISAVLKENGFHFSKARGQNFLTDASIPQKMAESVDRSMGILEIGPGFGALTAALCSGAGKVVAVETDKRLIPILKSNLKEHENLVLVEADALKTNISALIEEHFRGLVPAAVCNLPYALTSDMLTLLIEARELKWFRVMVQKEVAERICAAPGTAAYGSFSVFAQAHGKSSVLFDVHPHSFVPQPGVTSSVFSFERYDMPLVPEKLRKLFFRIVRGAFSQRRKTILNSLAPALADITDKSGVAECLFLAGIDPARRGETFSIGEYLALTEEVYKKIKEF